MTRLISPSNSIFLCTLLLSVVQQIIIFAEAIQPLPASCVGYSTVNETTLYIHGGLLANGQPSNQMFALDLTRPSWSVTSPPWIALSLGTGAYTSLGGWQQPATILKDKKTMVMVDFNSKKISTYNIAKDMWLADRTLPPGTTVWGGLHMVTDPNTGYIYVPSADSNRSNILKFDPSTFKFETIHMPTQSFVVQGPVYYTVVWSTLRNSILLYGGFSANGGKSNDQILEYQPSTNLWTVIFPQGPSPGIRNSHCMVPAYKGTKMVLFGGRSATKQPLGSLFILDVKTMTWTKGAALDSAQNRSGPTCAVAGNNLVVWGGDQNMTNISKIEPLLIYNLKANQWTKQFKLP